MIKLIKRISCAIKWKLSLYDSPAFTDISILNINDTMTLRNHLSSRSRLLPIYLTFSSRGINWIILFNHADLSNEIRDEKSNNKYIMIFFF